ncbi:MAG: histidine phosphatase family protein [Pseudomonadota bacterium]
MRILLLRHAKSSWDHPGLRDHDRPLAGRGERAAPAMGAHFASSDLRIDRVISSTAERAIATARLFCESFDQQTPLTSHAGLYHADELTLLSIAIEGAHGDEGGRVMLVGHNPGMHDLALLLCCEGDPDDVARMHAKFPTGALAEFDLPLQQMVGRQSVTQLQAQLPAGRLVRFIRPKDLPGAKELRV